jgi:hypothetical protein
MWRRRAPLANARLRAPKPHNRVAGRGWRLACRNAKLPRRGSHCSRNHAVM